MHVAPYAMQVASQCLHDLLQILFQLYLRAESGNFLT